MRTLLVILLATWFAVPAWGQGEPARVPALPAETGAAGGAGADSGTGAETGTVTDPGAETETETETESESESGAESGTVTATATVIDSGAETGTATNSGAETGTVTATATVIDSGDDSDSEGAEAAGYPRFEASGRVMLGAEISRAQPEFDEQQDQMDSRQPFFFEQARVGLRVDANDWLRGRLSAGLDDKPALRSAYVNVKLDRAFQIRAGRFKRPSGRLANSSLIDLPFRSRGLFDARIVNDGEWGRRALGAMLWGKLRVPRLRWSAAVMNASQYLDVPDNQRLRGVALLARLEYTPVKWLVLSAHRGHKIAETAWMGPNRGLDAMGADVRIKAGDLRAVVETMLADNALPPLGSNDPVTVAAVVIGYIQYNAKLGKGFTLQPVVSAEWVDTDLDVSQDEAARAVVGLNLLFGKHLRVAPQVELTRPLGTVGPRSFVERNTFYVLVSGRI